MNSEKLHQAYVSAFAWLTPGTIIGLWISIAGLLLVLGLVFVFARPRAIGILLATLSLWLLPHTWMWYAVATIKQQEPVLIALIISMLTVSAIIWWASVKPTARETGQRMSLQLIGTGTSLFSMYHVLQYILWSMPHNPPHLSFYWLSFGLPLFLLSGTAFILVGVTTGIIARAQTNAPFRPIEMP